jgi:hypothetical protein
MIWRKSKPTSLWQARHEEEIVQKKCLTRHRQTPLSFFYNNKTIAPIKCLAQIK